MSYRVLTRVKLGADDRTERHQDDVTIWKDIMVTSWHRNMLRGRPTDHLWGNPSATSGFPSQRASNVWSHQVGGGTESHHADVTTCVMTSSNGNIFRVTDPLCGEFTGPGEFPTQRPVTRSFDVYFDLRLNKRLCKQSWGWWFETLLCPLWRHSNGKCVPHLWGNTGKRGIPFTKGQWYGTFVCPLLLRWRI